MDFDEYQNDVRDTNETGRSQQPLLGLVGEIGSVFSLFKKRQLHRGADFPTFKDQLREELGDTLWYLTNLAEREGLSLSEIAQSNIQKARAFHDEGVDQKFDEGYPEDERFPRKFEVVFSERKLERSVLVKLRINSVFIGDALTDNAYDDDGYRFHDVFHLGFLASLGWSPVLRDLLKCKRKSNIKVDEVEDGARAAIIEEAISIFIFNRARFLNFFENPKTIDLSLLKSVMSLVGHLEVKRCTAKQWRRAIDIGYAAFRDLKTNSGGIIEVNLDAHTLTYRPVT
jgi:NTP pyrophosphatase (non-canonical NTP hydrolase)